jgi:hypothetical protein
VKVFQGRENIKNQKFLQHLLLLSQCPMMQLRRFIIIAIEALFKKMLEHGNGSIVLLKICDKRSV